VRIDGELMEIWPNEVCDIEAVLCSKKRTDDYLWVINEICKGTSRVMLSQD